MRDVRAALVAFLLVASGCAAFTHEGKVATLDPKNNEPPADRFDALLWLADEAEIDSDTTPELYDLALRLADDPDTPIRLVALRILGRLGKQGVHPDKVAQTLSTHSRVKGGGEADIWCRIESLEGLTALVSVPQNMQPDESVRADVHEALRLAISADFEPDRDVRIHAARELATLRPDSTRVLDELVKALSDEAPDVRFHAQRALIAIAGEDHGPTKEDWATWVKRHAVEKGEPPR